MTLKRNRVMAMDQFLQLASPCHKGSEDSVRNVNICVCWCRAAKTEVVSLEQIIKKGPNLFTCNNN